MVHDDLISTVKIIPLYVCQIDTGQCRNAHGLHSSSHKLTHYYAVHNPALTNTLFPVNSAS